MFCHLPSFPHVASFPEYSLWPNKLGLLTFALNPVKKPLCVSCRTGNVLQKATTGILDLSHPWSSLNSEAFPPTYYHSAEVIQECFCFAHFLQTGLSSFALPVWWRGRLAKPSRAKRGTAWMTSCCSWFSSAAGSSRGVLTSCSVTSSAGQNRQFWVTHNQPVLLSATQNQMYTLKRGILAIYFSVVTVAKVNLFRITKFSGLNCCSLRH